MRQTRLLLAGGGSLMQDITSTRSLIYYLWVIRLARRLGAKTMLYANGIGPIKKAANIERMRNELTKMNLLTLRDEDSLALLKEHNVSDLNGPKIIVTADPAFSLPAPNFENARALLSKLGVQAGQFVCIALRHWRYNPPGFEQQIAKFADYLVEKYNYTILFTLMSPQQDTEISHKTMALMKQPAVLLDNVAGDMDSLRGVVGLSAFTLAMRLHSLIYAIDQGVPAIGLVYDPKVQGLMDSVGLPFYVGVEEADALRLNAFADELMGDYEGICAKVKQAGQEARALAKMNAEFCVSLLEE